MRVVGAWFWIGLGDTGGRPETRYREARRHQGRGDDPLPIVSGLHVVILLVTRRRVASWSQVHRRQCATDPNNVNRFL
jgi:hypothetical protein